MKTRKSQKKRIVKRKRRTRTRAKKTIYGGGLDQYASAPQDFVAFYLNKETDENKEKMIQEFEELIQKFKEEGAFKEDDGVIDLQNLSFDKPMDENTVISNLTEYLRYFGMFYKNSESKYTYEDEANKRKNNLEYMYLILSFSITCKMYIDEYSDSQHKDLFNAFIKIAIILKNGFYPSFKKTGDFMREQWEWNRFDGEYNRSYVKMDNNRRHMLLNAKLCFFPSKSIINFVKDFHSITLSKKQTEYANFVLDFDKSINYEPTDKIKEVHKLYFNNLLMHRIQGYVKNKNPGRNPETYFDM